MSRLHQRCVLMSALVHGLLLVILAVAPAWVGSRNRIDDLPLLDVIPTTAVDEAFSGGGSPTAVPPPPAARTDPAPPPVAAPPPAPPPEPKAEPKPEPRVEPEPLPKRTPEPPEKPLDLKNPGDEPVPPKPPKTAKKSAPPDRADQTPKAEKPRVKVDLTPIRRSNAAAAAERERERERARQDADAAAARRAQEDRLARISGSLQSIQGGVSKPLAPGSVVGIVGPGGEAYANIGQILKSIYYRAWNPPTELDDDGTTVETQVTVARDGSVVSGETGITRRSGVAALDKSVQQALDRVRSVAPLPESTKESQRTFKVIFSPKAKRLLG